MIRLLIVDDDPRVLEALSRSLRGRRADCVVTCAEGGAQALRALAAAPADIVVADLGMPGLDGAELLGRVAAGHPAAIRVILSGLADDASAGRAYRAAHQVLAKPCGSAALHRLVDRTVALQRLLPDPALRATLGAIDIPGDACDLRWEIALLALGATMSTLRLTALVERDAGLAAAVLQLGAEGGGGGSLSAGLDAALRRTTPDLLDALALHHGLARRGAAPADPIAHRHALAVARLARTMLSGAEGDEAYVAGLLHDVGKPMLAGHAGDRYGDVERAVVEGMPAHEAEEMILGTAHPAAAAYLLGIWGVSAALVDAVAHHHAPAAIPGPAFGPAEAVHVADALVHGAAEGPAAEARRLAPGVAIATGVADRLDGWRNAAAAAHRVAA